MEAGPDGRKELWLQTSSDELYHRRATLWEKALSSQRQGQSQRARLFHSHPTQSPGMAPVLCDSQVSMRTLTLAPWLPINSTLSSKGNGWAGDSRTGNPRSHGPLQSTGAPPIREPGNGTGSKLCYPGGHRTLGKQLGELT